MPKDRARLHELESRPEENVPEIYKHSVLSLLVRNPTKGYDPKEIAATTPLPWAKIHTVLQSLLDDGDIIKLSDHYLANTDRIDDLGDEVLTAEQVAVAESISGRNTAPVDVDEDQPEDIGVPGDDVLDE